MKNENLQPEDVQIRIGTSNQANLEEARALTHNCSNPLFVGPHPSRLPTKRSDWKGQHFMGIQGTSHLLSYQNSFFMIFSRHQLINNDQATGSPYLMVSETSERIVGSNGFKSYKPSDHEFCDIAGIKYENVDVLKHQGLKERFFPIEDKYHHPNSDTEDEWTIVGYPKKQSSYEVDDEGFPIFNQSFVELFGRPKPEDRAEAKPICSIELHRRNNGTNPLDGDYDCLSGSPVFAWSAKRLDLQYRGMVITGGESTVRIIREAIILDFLKQI